MVVEAYDINETEYVTLRVEDVYKAIKKNGFEWVREQYEQINADGEVYAGCVLGQASFNLNVDPANDDNWYHSLVGQLNTFNVSPDSRWYTEQQPQVGFTITTWNDKIIHYGHEMDDASFGGCLQDAEYDEKHSVEGYVPTEWALNTYEEVVQMCYDILSPYFNETIRVIKKTWKIPASILGN